MFSNVVSAAAVVLGAARLASAQTFTSCNPLQKSCPADPAFGGTYTIDFTKGASDLFTAEAGTSLTYDANKGAVFTINQPGDAPTIASTKYLFFGRVDVVLQAAPGTGIVTSCVLQSDDLDEIDWEWLGGDTTQVQTNYYSKGDTSTYDRGGFSSVANPQSSFHTYTIDWTPQALNWMIDGTVVRTLTYAAASGGATYPQTPMQIKLGTWDGGAPNEAPGTVQWAGGYTNFANAPFIGYYKSITVTDYSNGVSGASEYVYGDKSGTYGSIKVITGSGAANTTDPPSSTSSSVASTTKTTSSMATTSSTKNSTTLSSSTISISNSTLSTSAPTATAAATTSTSSATAAPKNAAEKLGFSFANAALIVAGVFGYLVL